MCDGKRGRPLGPSPRVEHFVQLLCNDKTWQDGIFSPEEVEVLLDMADRYLRLQLGVGFRLEESYDRVRAMLAAAKRYEEAKEQAKSDAGDSRGEPHDDRPDHPVGV